ncbi:MAG: acetylxylan esterase [Gemmataceae bacterium]
MLTRRDLLRSAAAAPLACSPVFGRIEDAPADTRLKKVRTLDDTDFDLAVPATKEAWLARRQKVREQVLVSQGLWPLPEKTPLCPVVHGKLDRGDYTIEKVFFASTPGHYVSGSLYRPAKGEGKRPAVLFAHGHWAGGRFEVAAEAAAKKAVERGEEPDLLRGRYFMQALPVTLARLGFVVFQYDMVGYADSKTIPHREGFKEAAAELRAQSFMGLQTWNSVRALDFVTSLPDVDPTKVGVTGASGGGTQTFILAAIDDRLAAAFPAVMVSTAMQGGCVCENASLLRVGTGNIELAGVFAPKPQAMSCADDWTKDVPKRGLPELKRLYALFGAEEKVAAKYWSFPHNYGHPSRVFMYGWFNKHLAGKDGPVEETPFDPVPPKELSVYDAEHPRPADDLPADKLREKLSAASDAQMAKLSPTDAKSLAEFTRVVGTALRVMVQDELPPPKPGLVSVAGFGSEGGPGGATVHRAHLGRGKGEAVPSMGVIPEGFIDAGKTAVVWLHPQGRASLKQGDDWTPAVKTLLAAKTAVLAIDLFKPPALPIGKVTHGQVFGGYFYGYNRAVLAERVRDAVTAVVNLRDNAGCKTIHVVGWEECGPVAILAKAICGDAVTKLAADAHQFRFESVTKLDDPMMLPGAVKYGGLPAFLALCAPSPALVHNHKGTASGKLSKAAYDATGAADKLTRSADKWPAEKVAGWLAG